MHGSMRRREATNASRASTRRAAAEASRRPYLAAKRWQRRPARAASASTSAASSTSDTRFHRAAPAIRNVRRRARRPRGHVDLTNADEVRERARTHRSGRYRSDLSRDPPSAAASAQETRRVLPGSCKARARRAFAPQSPTPGKAICLFLPFRMSCRARQSRPFAGELDGETRTRTGDTTVFRA
jgi:hypothetical protein